MTTKQRIAIVAMYAIALASCIDTRAPLGDEWPDTIVTTVAFVGSVSPADEIGGNYRGYRIARAEIVSAYTGQFGSAITEWRVTFRRLDR